MFHLSIHTSKPHVVSVYMTPNHHMMSLYPTLQASLVLSVCLTPQSSHVASLYPLPQAPYAASLNPTPQASRVASLYPLPRASYVVSLYPTHWHLLLHAPCQQPHSACPSAYSESKIKSGFICEHSTSAGDVSPVSTSMLVIPLFTPIAISV